MKNFWKHITLLELNFEGSAQFLAAWASQHIIETAFLEINGPAQRPMSSVCAKIILLIWMALGFSVS
jgi:hypothetical protein